MSDFSFTATAQCDRCGNYLSSSTDECNECSESDLERYHFKNVVTSDTEVTWSINPVRAWHDLVKKIDRPLGWKCVDRGVMDIHMAQDGTDVRELWREEQKT